MAKTKRTGSSRKNKKSTLTLLKLTPKIVETTWLYSVDIEGDGHTDVPNSWEGLILYLIGMTVKTFGDQTISKLLRARVLSADVTVETSYIDRYEPGKTKTVVYQIPNTPFYIGLRRNPESYCKAVKGLALIMKKNPKDIVFNTEKISEELLGLEGVQVIKEEKTLVELAEAESKLDNLNGSDVESVAIFGSKEQAKDIHQALQLIVMWTTTVYGDIFTQSAFKHSEDEVGITIISEADKYDTRFKVEKLGDYYLYSSGNVKAIIRFLINTLIETGLAPDLVSIGYKYIEKGRK